MPEDANQGNQNNQSQGQNQGSGQNGENQSQNGSGQHSQENPPDWRESLSTPELKTDTRLERFKTVDDVAKSWIEAQTVISKKGLILPDEKAAPEEWGKVWNALGRPEKPDGYELVKPELPEGMTYDEEKTKAFAAKAHELGLSKSQLKGLHETWNELAKSEFEKHTAAADDFLKKSVEAIKKEWGSSYDANLKKADSAIATLFGEDFRKMLIDTGLNNHPAVIKGMFKASQAISEDSFIRGDGTGKTKTSITYAEILSAKNDPRYYDVGRRDPAYVAKVEKMVNEYAAAQGA